jgi:transcriptional regulator with GAF, ATPase, and Fis domain
MRGYVPEDAAAPAATREQSLADVFVTLADTLVDDYDVVDLLDGLVRACVQLLGVTAAGLLLDDQKGNLALVASSSQETRLLELFVLQNDEGPCLDCVRQGAPVTSDLEAEASRWPLFVPAARSAGFSSVSAMPLRLRDQTIGCLSLFMSTAEVVPPADRRIAQALASVATIGILQQRTLHRSHVLSEQLQNALTSRITIEQAKGFLAERNGITPDVAYEAMRRYARDHNLKLTGVAQDIVHSGLNPRHALPSRET